jgi:hypothetical protein
LVFSRLNIKPNNISFKLFNGITNVNPKIFLQDVYVNTAAVEMLAVSASGTGVPKGSYERKADIASKALLTLSGHAFIFKSLKAWAPHSRLLPYSFRSGLTTSRRESHQIGLTVF